jgi:hypothetical protein
MPWKTLSAEAQGGGHVAGGSAMIEVPGPPHPCTGAPMVHSKDRVPLSMETSCGPAHIVSLSASRHAVEKVDGHACVALQGMKGERIPIVQLQSVILPGKFRNGVGQRNWPAMVCRWPPLAQKGGSQVSSGLDGVWPFMVISKSYRCNHGAGSISCPFDSPYFRTASTPS